MPVPHAGSDKQPSSPTRREAGDDEVVLKFSGTLGRLSSLVLGSLRQALPLQTRFVVDLSALQAVMPGALAELEEAIGAAQTRWGWRVSIAAIPGPALALTGPTGGSR